MKRLIRGVIVNFYEIIIKWHKVNLRTALKLDSKYLHLEFRKFGRRNH